MDLLALRTWPPAFPPKISSAPRPPRRPFMLGALTVVATKRLTRWTRVITRRCCAEADVADVREQVGIALSELSLGSHDLNPKPPKDLN